MTKTKIVEAKIVEVLINAGDVEGKIVEVLTKTRADEIENTDNKANDIGANEMVINKGLEGEVSIKTPNF